ncbi:MAG: alcohol dehydrogenase catalytic domain-containing protein [Elusimicrobia bacterium]|nr:alcohol dehydrogenase catalytic domain-containing protein [Elusimicrobiota bacterium]
MKALQYEGLNKVVFSEVPVPVVSDGEVLVAVEICGLCGSDVLKIDSDIRGKAVCLGHELAGRIELVGPGVKGFKRGDRVVVAHHVPCGTCHYCRKASPSMCREFKQTNLDPGGFSEYVRVSSRHVENVMLKIPAKVSYAQAALTEPLACVLRNIRRLGVVEGDTVVIVGLGFIGLLSAMILIKRGVTVIGLDLDPARVRMANKLGLEHAYTGRENRTEAVLSQLTQGRGADAVIVTAGPASLVNQRLAWVRDGGIVNLFAGFHKQAPAHIDLDALYHRELTILTSYSPALEDLREAHRMICAAEIDLSPFVKSQFALDRFDEALRQVRGREIVKAMMLPHKHSSPG